MKLEEETMKKHTKKPKLPKPINLCFGSGTIAVGDYGQIITFTHIKKKEIGAVCAVAATTASPFMCWQFTNVDSVMVVINALARLAVRNRQEANRSELALAK